VSAAARRCLAAFTTKGVADHLPGGDDIFDKSHREACVATDRIVPCLLRVSVELDGPSDRARGFVTQTAAASSLSRPTTGRCQAACVVDGCPTNRSVAIRPG
jgi:hypothetical protein